MVSWFLFPGRRLMVRSPGIPRQMGEANRGVSI